MSLDNIIAISASIITVIGMLITIWQVFKAKNYKEQIKFDIRKINLSGIVEKLKRAQDEVRKLPTSLSNVKRGIKPLDIIKDIKSYFDFSLSLIDVNGPDKDLRELLSSAQQKLNSYEVSYNDDNIDAQELYSVQELIQDVISQANTKIYKFEGKA